jgi:hypothetical protein
VDGKIRDASDCWRLPLQGGRHVRFLLGHVPSPGSRLASTLSWHWRAAHMRFHTVNEQSGLRVSVFLPARAMAGRAMTPTQREPHGPEGEKLSR